MRGYVVPIVLFVAADDEEQAYFRAERIATNIEGGKHYHGCEIEDYPKMTLIPELGA
jgi:hypothetical protein